MSDMSDLVATSVKNAARDTVATNGGMLTGFVALTTYLNSDGVRCWAMSAGDEQGLAASMGMANILEMTVRAQVEAAFFNDDGDDD